MQRVDRIFRNYARSTHAPGVAFGVIAGGGLMHAGCFGLRHIAKDARVEPDTVFRIASMTKSFTALAVLQLRDAGRLQLDQPAEAFVPELAGLAYPTSDAAPITIRQLLSMTAGWPQDDPWADRQLACSDADLDALFRAGASFSNPPGVTFEYSNYAYMVLGRVISRASGQPALDYIARRIIQPLGMTSTVWNATDVPATRLAQGYRWEDAQWKPETPLPSGGDVAAFAGLLTTVADLARWVGLFLSAWPPRDDPDQGILRRSSLREMQQVWSLREPSVSQPELGARPRMSAGGYGFGLGANHTGRWATIGHGGGVPGFGSHMRWSPLHGIGVVALANVTYADMHTACGEALDALLAAAPVPVRVALPDSALARARAGMLALLDEWDDALADALFADNFFLDLDRAHWQRRLAELRALHGRLRATGGFRPENLLRGRWTMTGRRGWCNVFISMSATVPPRIQHVSIESVVPPSPIMRAVAEKVAVLVAKPSLTSLRRILSPDADARVLWSRLRVANALLGGCSIGAVRAGDGADRAVFQLKGGRERCELALTLAPGTGKLRDAVVRRAELR